MKKFVVCISFKQLQPFIILFISTLLLLLFFSFQYKQIIPTSRVLEKDMAKNLEEENLKLKGVLQSIFPASNKIIYENPFRDFSDQEPSFKTYPLHEIIEKGKDIPFEVLLTEDNYERPTYDSRWKDFYFRKWLYLPLKLSDARHRLFIYQGGASIIFDMEGRLGFHLSDTTVIDKLDYLHSLNFLVYSFQVHEIKVYNNQILLIGEPARTGAQILSIDLQHVMPQWMDSKDFLYQLSTPYGYEIDYLYGSYYRSNKEKEETNLPPYSMATNAQLSLEELQSNNIELKKELSHYIPLEDDLFLTSQLCRHSYKSNITTMKDVYAVRTLGEEIPFRIGYFNQDYKRPLYDPAWKENAEKGWTYIPDKICESMHRLFIIPKETIHRDNFFGNLGFHQTYEPLNDNEVGFLLYNFIPQKVMVLDNQLMIIGTPSRTGAYMIGVDQDLFVHQKDYLIQLITLDDLEVDYEILPLLMR